MDDDMSMMREHFSPSDRNQHNEFNAFSIAGLSFTEIQTELVTSIETGVGLHAMERIMVH